MTSTAMTIANPKTNALTAMPSPIGNLDGYIRAVQQYPMLTEQEEQSLARRLRDQDDLDAARQLILSHLRLVVSTARQYLGYGLPHADLIQEGNIGLMKAVKRFDPERGVRLVSFAMHWIKAEIHEYILKNWRLVKVATTKAQRKLFFNLRSMKGNASHLDQATTQAIASQLNVSEADVREMDMRLTGRDIALDPGPDVSDEDSFAPIDYLADDSMEPTAVLEDRARDHLHSDGLQQALSKLDDRSRHIVQARWLADDGGATLQELADEYGVSAERVRQIEAKALKSLRTHLAPA
ncbi:MAG: RNA polymerase sigma factor RpoH [Fluviibacter sp.]